MKEEFKKYYHPKFKIVANMIRLLYSLDRCKLWRLLSYSSDDNNIRNSDLKCVIKYCDENKDSIDCELSKAICEIMLQMTIEQRIILFYSLELEDDFYFNKFEEYEYDTYFDAVHDPEYIIHTCKDEDRFNITE